MSQFLTVRVIHSALALLALLASLAASPGYAAGEYLLGPQDRIRLKIYEWRASRDAIFEWTALNDEFTVGADGFLSLPFVGAIQAEGRPAAALAGTIAERLVYDMGLGQAPDVAVEVVQFRPFYIVGQVMQPGEFPYRPGLTVLQAVSIAGGLRIQEDSIGRFEREVIAGRGDVSLLSLSNVSLLARRARLEAELQDAEEVAFPAELAEDPPDEVAAVLMQQESVIFAARRDGLTTQLRALTDLRKFLERETESLRIQLGLLDQQVDSVKAELGTVTDLVDQGLAVAPRQLALERSLLQVQSDRLSAETSLLRARQEISRTDLTILELRNRHTNEVATELRETQTQLDEINRRTDTALLLLHESEAAAPRLLAMRAAAALAEPTFRIVRPAGDEVVEIDASETTALEPGDTLKVRLPLPSELDAQPPIAAPAAGLSSTAHTASEANNITLLR